MIPTDKLWIACDLDDCGLDFMGGIQRSVMKEYGVVVPDFDSWEIADVLDPILGQSWWTWLRERDWLWPNFPAMDGFIGAVTQLRRDGFFMELVTAKPIWAEFIVWRWLGKWRAPFHRVTLLDMDMKKTDMTEADVLIDDRPENALQFARDGRVGILFNRPHNLGFEIGDEPGLYRARDWPHVVELVRMEEEALL